MLYSTIPSTLTYIIYVPKTCKYNDDKDGKYEVRNETKDEQEYRDGASGYHFEIYDTSDDSGKKYGDFYVDKDTGKIYKRNTKTEKLEEYKK